MSLSRDPRSLNKDLWVLTPKKHECAWHAHFKTGRLREYKERKTGNLVSGRANSVRK